MDLKSISALRIANQMISGQLSGPAVEVVRRMGAIQAQDYKMAKWAIGIRCKGSDEEAVNAEINAGTLIRTHLLRPTWHFVSKDDIYWISGLSAARIRGAMQYRDRQLELTAAIFRKCNSLFEKILRDGNHMTREELFPALLKSGLKAHLQQASHLFIRAETEGIICSGMEKKGKPTFALLGEWVPQRKDSFTREEALTELAKRYFRSRGPASLQDFTWWSGLTATEARKGFENNRDDMNSVNIDDQTFWFYGDPNVFSRSTKGIYFLPAYDELLISYRDRRAAIAEQEHKKAVSENGIFYPLIIHDGQVSGTWKRITVNNTMAIIPDLFDSKKRDMNAPLRKAAGRYASFFGKSAELKIIALK